MNVGQIRERLDTLTGGGLHALNYVCRTSALEPDICMNKTKEGYTKFTFVGTSSDGTITYHNTVTVPSDLRLELSLEIYLKMRAVKKETARILHGLGRLEAGLTPTESDFVPTLH